jgi:hypothetical protein
MKDEDFEILGHHLANKTSWARQHECPACGTDQWNVGGPIGAPVYEDTSKGPGKLGPAAMLFVTLTCKTCFYTMFFQWLPIQEGASNG